MATGRPDNYAEEVFGIPNSLYEKIEMIGYLAEKSADRAQATIKFEASELNKRLTGVYHSHSYLHPLLSEVDRAYEYYKKGLNVLYKAPELNYTATVCVQDLLAFSEPVETPAQKSEEIPSDKSSSSIGSVGSGSARSGSTTVGGIVISGSSFSTTGYSEKIISLDDLAEDEVLVRLNPKFSGIAVILASTKVMKRKTITHYLKKEGAIFFILDLVDGSCALLWSDRTDLDDPDWFKGAVWIWYSGYEAIEAEGGTIEEVPYSVKEFPDGYNSKLDGDGTSIKVITKDDTRTESDRVAESKLPAIDVWCEGWCSGYIDGTPLTKEEITSVPGWEDVERGDLSDINFSARKNVYVIIVEKFLDEYKREDYGGETVVAELTGFTHYCTRTKKLVGRMTRAIVDLVGGSCAILEKWHSRGYVWLWFRSYDALREDGWAIGPLAHPCKENLKFPSGHPLWRDEGYASPSMRNKK